MSRKGNISLDLTIDHDISTIQRIRDPRQPFKKIFQTFLKESHMLGSIFFETLRPFPRPIRALLLFTQIYLELLFANFYACLWGHYKEIYLISFWVVFLSQLLVILISNINRTSNKSLERAKNTEQFIQISKSIEKRIKIKWAFICILCTGIISFSCIYTVVFFAIKGESLRANALVIFLVSFVLDFGFFQFLEAFLLSLVKYGSYKSRIMRNFSNVLKVVRIWKSTNPDLDR